MAPAKKICFVGADNYPVLNPAKGNEYFGGESVQQTLLARAFRDLGYDVSMVVQDYGQPQGELIDGIRVWKTFDVRAGVPVLRFLYPRMTSILSALKRADADIYYQSCAGMMTGVVAWFCRRYGRKFIFRLAHDSDCIPGEQIIRLWRDRKIYEYGLRQAGLIAAQGVKQVALLKDNYQLGSTPVNMAVELPDPEQTMDRDIDILWVNNLRDFKRPELVIKLARMLPEYRVMMIGAAVPGSEELYKEVEAQAGMLPNLDFLGAVSYNEVNGYFSRSRIFVNTSDWEGFPNSFLQAWVRGVPVISFFDPDGLIAGRELGAVPTDLASMAQVMGELLRDEGARSTVAQRSRKFVIDNYAPTAVAKTYEKLILSGEGGGV